MPNIDTHILVNDVGWEHTEFRFDSTDYGTEGVGVHKYDPTYMYRNTNDFGIEGSKRLVEFIANPKIEVGDYECSIGQSINDLGEVEDLIHLKWNDSKDLVYNIGNPWNDRRLYVGGWINYSRNNSYSLRPGRHLDDTTTFEDNDSYHISNYDTKLMSSYNKLTKQECNFGGIGLADWEFNQYGRMDKIFDVSALPSDADFPDDNEEALQAYSEKGRFKIGIKYGDNVVYLIDALNNTVYKKDIYISSDLNRVADPSWPQSPYLHQLPFDSTGGVSYTSPDTNLTRVIRKMSDYGNMTIRSGTNILHKEGTLVSTNKASSFMVAVDFGDPGETVYNTFTLAPVINASGSTTFSQLIPHKDYDCLGFLTVHDMYRPSEAKVIMGATWTCIKKTWDVYMPNSGFPAGLNSTQYDWITNNEVRINDMFFATDRYVDENGDASGSNNWPAMVYSSNRDIIHNNRMEDVNADEAHKYVYSIGKNFTWLANGGSNAGVGGYGLAGADFMHGGQNGSWMLVYAMPHYNYFKKVKVWKHESRLTPVEDRTINDMRDVYISAPTPMSEAGFKNINWNAVGGYNQHSLNNQLHGSAKSIDGPTGNFFYQEPVVASGTHTSANGSPVLIAAAGSFTGNEFVDASDSDKFEIVNVTDNSRAIVVSNTTQNVIHYPLQGGTANAWNIGDTFEVRIWKSRYLVTEPEGGNLDKEIRFFSGFNQVSNWGDDAYDSQGPNSTIFGNDTEQKIAVSGDFVGDVRYLKNLNLGPYGYDHSYGTSHQAYLFWADGKFIQSGGSLILDKNNDNKIYIYAKDDISETDFKGNLINISHRWSNAWGGSLVGHYWHTFWNESPLDWGYAGLYSDILERKELAYDTNVDLTNSVQPNGSGSEMWNWMFMVLNQKGCMGYDIRIADRNLVWDEIDASVVTEQLIQTALGNYGGGGWGQTEYGGSPYTILLDTYRGGSNENHKLIDANFVFDTGTNNKMMLYCTYVNDEFGRKKDTNYSHDSQIYRYNFDNEHTDIGMREQYKSHKGTDEIQSRIVAYNLSELDANRSYKATHQEVYYSSGTVIQLSFNSIDNNIYTDANAPNYSQYNNVHKCQFAGQLKEVDKVNIGPIQLDITLNMVGGVPTSVTLETNPYFSTCVITNFKHKDVMTHRLTFNMTAYGITELGYKDVPVYILGTTHQLTRWDLQVYRPQHSKHQTLEYNSSLKNEGNYNYYMLCENKETQAIDGYRSIVCPGNGNQITMMTSRDDSHHYRISQHEVGRDGHLIQSAMGTSYERSDTDSAWPERYAILDNFDYITQDGDNYVTI